MTSPRIHCYKWTLVELKATDSWLSGCAIPIHTAATKTVFRLWAFAFSRCSLTTSPAVWSTCKTWPSSCKRTDVKSSKRISWLPAPAYRKRCRHPSKLSSCWHAKWSRSVAKTRKKHCRLSSVRYATCSCLSWTWLTIRAHRTTYLCLMRSTLLSRRSLMTSLRFTTSRRVRTKFRFSTKEA